MRLRKIIQILAVLAVLLVALFFALPWQTWLQQKLITAIENKGIRPVMLSIDALGLRKIALKDVTLGEPPLKLTNLSVGYSPRDLMKGIIEDVELSGLTLDVSQNAKGWSVTGLDALLQKKPEEAEKKPFVIPVTNAELSAIPLRSIAVTKSTVHVVASGWEVNAPLELNLRKEGAAKITLESAGITAIKGADQVSTGKLTLELALDEATKQWQGKWAVADIAYTGEAAAIPKLSASGELTLTADAVQLTGTLDDRSKAYSAAFAMDYSLSKPETSLLTVTRARIPWGGGGIGAAQAKIPLVAKKSTTVNLVVKEVAVESLLQALTDNKANATGTVSGTLPIIITASGEVRIGKGALRAQEPGVIKLSPDAIPGDNAQVTLVRDVLKDLNYSLLSLDLDMAPDNTLSALLVVEGNNPAVQNGRAIKLQVHLSGDVLNLIKQNVMLMTDPQSFMKQENHE